MKGSFWVHSGGWFGLVLSTMVALHPVLAASDELPARVTEVVRGFGGKLHFAAEDLKTGRRMSFQADEPVQTASVIKFPIMVEVFAQVREGRLEMDRKLRYQESGKVPGAGILQDLTPGMEVSVRDAVVLMIALSDNTATNMLIDQVGVDEVNRRIHGLGLPGTWLNRKVYLPDSHPVPPERARFGLGVTTASEMLALLVKLYRRELVDAAASEEMIGILRKQRDLEQIPRLLAGPDWEGVTFAHKTGALNQVRNDVGLVFTPWGDYALSLFAQQSPDQRWTPENEAGKTLARLAEAIVSHWRGAGER